MVIKLRVAHGRMSFVDAFVYSTLCLEKMIYHKKRTYLQNKTMEFMLYLVLFGARLISSAKY
jgi:hypothetical protein